MLSLLEKAKCSTGKKDDVVTLLKDLFQHERYEDIVEAIDFHACTQADKKGRRDSFYKDYVIPLISNMITAIGNKLLDFRQGTWEDFFKKNNEEGKAWRDFILECLQSRRTGTFSSGIQAIKLSIREFNKTR